MGSRRVALSTGPDRSVKGPSRTGLLHAFAVLVFVGLLVIAVLRLLNPASSFIATGLIGITPLAFLGTPVVLGYGLAKKLRWLSLPGLVLFLLFGFWASADFRFGPGQGEKPEGAIRVASANMLVLNPDPVLAATDLVSTDPDLILLQELTPGIWDQLEDLPGLEPYKFRQLNAQGNPDDTAILSRLPFSASGVLYLGVTPATWVELELEGQDVRFINSHMAAPFNSRSVTRATVEYSALAPMVQDSPLPLVIGGDFNSTAQHHRLQDLMGQGLADAHQQAGRGFGATWGVAPLPAILRIDHVLMTEEIEAVHSWTEPLSGSDHRMLIVDLIAASDSDLSATT